MKPILLSLLLMVLLPVPAAPQFTNSTPYEDTIYPFNAVFDLWVEDTLRTQWSDAQFDTFMNAVFDADTTNTDDPFPTIWDYLCPADQDPAWDGIRYKLAYSDTTRIRIDLNESYDTAAFPGILYIDVVDTSGVAQTPLEVARGWGFAHEFTHVLDYANRHTFGEAQTWATNEFFGESGGFLLGTSPPPPPPTSPNAFFDLSLDGRTEYRKVYRLFWSYVLANYSGGEVDPFSPEDDLLYNWARVSPVDLSMYGMGATLDSLRGVYPDLYGHLGGSADQMVGTLLHEYALARYINDPDALGGRGGFLDIYTPRTEHLFEYVTAQGNPRVRAIPPDFTVNATQHSVSTYTDTAQTTPCPTKDLGVRRWGADYLVFRADSAYFANKPDTTLGLTFTLNGLATSDSVRMRIGYIAYDSYESNLFDKPVVKIEPEIDQWRTGDGNTLSKFTVDGFGHTVKGVVVVITLAEDPLQDTSSQCDDRLNDFCLQSGTCYEPHMKYEVTYGLALPVLHVPEDHDKVQDAIDVAAIGQIVRVQPRESPWEPFVMKRGVIIEGDPHGPRPTASAPDSSVIVRFPSAPQRYAGMDTSTVLRHFRITGGTDSGIRLEYPGVVEDCFVERGYAPGGRGIHAAIADGDLFVLNRVIVRSCTLAVDYGSGNNGTLAGIESSAKSNLSVSDTWITMDGETNTPANYNGIYGSSVFQKSNVADCLITGAGAGTGIRMLGSLDVVAGSTIDGTALGVHLAGGLVRYSIVSGTTETYSISGSGMVETCIASGAIQPTTTGDTYPNTDPLFCGNGAYTLRIDSRGNPRNNTAGVQIGRYPTVCALGTLQIDTAVNGAIAVRGDLTIPSGRTLTLETGADLQVSPTDQLGAGVSTDAVEVRVDGALLAGSETIPFITIRGASSTRGSWDGILCGPEAKVTLDGVTLRDGRYGLWDNSAAAADSIVVDNCEIANVEEAAIHLAPSSASASAPSDLRIIHTSFDMVGSPYAIVLSSSGASLGYNAVLTSFTIDNAGDSTGVAGLVLDQAGTSETQVIDCNVQNLPVGTGVRVLSHSPILIRNRVADCRTGVELRGSGTPRVASDLTSGPPGKRIWNCDTGIFIHSTGADLESLVVSVPLMNPPPNPCAIWADTVSAVSVSDCSFILTSSAVGMWSNGGDIDMVGTTMDIVGGSGLRLTGGESHVTDCTITVTDGASTNRGIKSDGAPSGSGIQIDHCFLSVPGGTGVEALTTNVNHTVEFCTVDSAGIGFHDEQGGTIRNCIATNCSTNGFETSASNKATYCIAPDGYSPSAGTGSVTEDPYYCVPGSEFTLKVDSYGNPYNNDSELQIGAYPVACMYGTLARDSKFGGGSLSVTGDATIPVAKELTLLSGADVVADSTVLITASGTLRAIGDSANVVVFRGSANAPGHWDGIMTTGNEGNGGGRIVLSYAEIRDAVNCVQDDNTWPADSLYLAHVSMSSFSNAAVNAVPFFSNNSADLGLDHCTIDMTGAPYGIRINRDDLSSQTLPSYKVVVQNTTITGDGSGTYGVYLDAEAQGGQKDAKVQNLRISGLTAGTGIYVEDLSPSLFATRNDSIVISNCKWGIQLHGDGAPDLDVEVPPIGNDGLFRIEGCTEGLLVEDTCSPEVSSITIKSLVDTGYGLHTRDSAGGTYTGLTITRGWYGVRAWSDAAQEIRSSAITDFSQYGVGVSSTGLMDLGDAPGDPGNNNIHSNSTTYSTVFYVGVKNRVAELGDVPAESNWWGEYPPPSSKFSAAVDYDPAIVLDPTLASDRVAFVVIPPHATLMARPNPFRQGGAVIEYGVPEGVGPVRLELFDVSGRRVRALLDGESPPGYHTVSWDGRDSSGRETATGIYFIRFQAGDQVKTTKLVRVW